MLRPRDSSQPQSIQSPQRKPRRVCLGLQPTLTAYAFPHPRGYNLPVKYQVILRAGEDGWIVAECPDLPGCISQGKTRDEALANITEAIQLSLETRRDLAREDI